MIKTIYGWWPEALHFENDPLLSHYNVQALRGISTMTAAGHRMFNAGTLRLLIGLTMAVLLSGCGINNIPTYEEQMKASWSQVLNQYKRRADLIPNLVETVKGYAAQEKDVLTSVIEARARATQVQLPPDIVNNPAAFRQFQESQAQLSGALARLLAVVENYPDLKSNQNFLALQSQLEGTENRISVARRDYVGAVRIYNTELRTIPGRWWAALLYPDAKLAQTFTIQEKDMSVPEVDFSPGTPPTPQIPATGEQQ